MALLQGELWQGLTKVLSVKPGRSLLAHANANEYTYRWC